MQPLKLFTDDERGVSPVIAVILMVAITVILAAVIGSFVLSENNLGDQVPAPEANWEPEEQSSGTLVVRHQGGDKVKTSRLSVKSSGGSISVNKNDGGDGEITAGDDVTVSGLNNGQEVQFIWTDDSGSGQTAVIFEHTY